MLGYDFEDGSRAWIAHDSFRPFNNPNQDWGRIGIIPDLIAIRDWDLFTFETDPVIHAALEYFDQLHRVDKLVGLRMWFNIESGYKTLNIEMPM